MINIKFTKEQEKQICNEYFSEEKPSTIALGKKWNCWNTTIGNIIKRNGLVLRTSTEVLKGRFVGEKHPFYGQHHTEKTRRILKEKSIKNNSRYWLNKHHSEKSKQKQREKTLLRIQNHPGPFKDAKPELKMKEILNELNIPFKHQFRLKNHLFDFHILNSNILIEVDGDYFHSNPKKFSKLNKMQLKQKRKDIGNEKLAKENNFILLRFWEDDILNNTEEVIEHIKKKVR